MTRTMKRTKTTNKLSCNAGDDRRRDLGWKWLLIPASALLAAVLLNTLCMICAIVPSSSMEPTIEEDALLVANRLAYINKSPKRGDVILFYHEELGTSLIVKRIIGLPGETVEIRSGQVYIDETTLEELYVTNASSDNLDPVTIPAGHYFVLGDNRGHSHDARFWEDPFVSTEEIRAKAVFTLLPSVQTIE